MLKWQQAYTEETFDLDGTYVGLPQVFNPNMVFYTFPVWPSRVSHYDRSKLQQ